MITRNRPFHSTPFFDRNHSLAANQAGCFIPVSGLGMVDAMGINRPVQNDLPRGVGPYGPAPNPDGTSTTQQRIDLGPINSSNPLSLAGVTQLTIAFHGVINSIGGGGFGRLIDKSNAGAFAEGWGINAIATNRLNFQINAAPAVGSGDNVFTAGVEADWAVVRTGTGSGGVIWYKDGVQFITGTSATTIPATTTNAAIGHWNHATTTRGWDGRIDWIQVWARALSAAAVLDLVSDPFPQLSEQGRDDFTNFFIPPEVPAAATIDVYEGFRRNVGRMMR